MMPDTDIQTRVAPTAYGIGVADGWGRVFSRMMRSQHRPVSRIPAINTQPAINRHVRAAAPFGDLLYETRFDSI